MIKKFVEEFNEVVSESDFTDGKMSLQEIAEVL